MGDVYENIDHYKPNRKIKILIVLDYMITYIMSNKRFQAIIKELFVRCRKLNSTHYFILTTDTTLPSSDPLRFRTNLCSSYEDDSN